MLLIAKLASEGIFGDSLIILNATSRNEPTKALKFGSFFLGLISVKFSISASKYGLELIIFFTQNL